MESGTSRSASPKIMHKDPHIANIFSAEEEDCLNLEQMAAYQQGKLAGQEKHLVERHLLNCELCAMTYESLTESTTEVLVAGAAEVADRAWDRVQMREQRKRRGAIFWIASAASIVLLVTVGYFTMRGPTDEEIAQTLAQAGENTPPRDVPTGATAPIAAAETPELQEDVASGANTVLQATDLKDNEQAMTARPDNDMPSKSPAPTGKEGTPLQANSGKESIKGGGYDSPKAGAITASKPSLGAVTESVDRLTVEGKAAPVVAAAAPVPKDYNGARKSSDLEAMKKEDRSLSKVTVLDDVVFDGEAERDISAADDGLTRVAGLANEEVAEELQSTTYSAASQKRLAEKPSKQAKSRANNAVDIATKEKAIVAGVPAPAPVVVAADSSYAQGLISYKEGNYRDAAKDLRKATERTPNNLEAHIYAADAFLRISQPQAALFHIERILAVPGNSHIEDAEWYKALAYLQLKDASKAKRQLEVVVTRGGKYKAHAETALKNLK